MTGAMMTAILVLFAISVPIAIALCLASMVGLFGFTTLPAIILPQQFFIALDKFPLAAIPFFILAGNLMEVGGMSRRLVEFARAFFGPLQGGLAATCVLTCMMFSAISGSSIATMFAVGTVLIPAMRHSGYPVGFTAALMAVSAELGVIIPPSIPMILYGFATQTSIPALFLAGVLPGLLIAGALLVTVLIWCRLRMGDAGIEEMRVYLGSILPNGQGDFIECTPKEGEAALLNRFTSGSAIVRYRAVHPATVEDIVALDVALPRNTVDWFETLPPEIEAQIALKIYVGHFLCHVMHQEYLVKKGMDCAVLEHEVCELLDARGAEYPAEHNVGHLYAAKPALKAFYRALDPTNRFNPGIGKTSKCRDWH